MRSHPESESDVRSKLAYKARGMFGLRLLVRNNVTHQGTIDSEVALVMFLVGTRPR